MNARSIDVSKKGWKFGMPSRRLKIWQYNCARSYAVMGDLGVHLCEQQVDVALLQEPYVVGEALRGLPSGMRVCVVNEGKAAIVVCNSSVNVMCLNDCMCEIGVCVWIKCEWDEMYVCSAYASPSLPEGPVLEYLEKVVNRVGPKKLLIGMDMNAVSPMWHSKYHVGRRQREARGEVVEKFLVDTHLVVLNRPSSGYTYSGHLGESDIDVSVVNENWHDCEFEWNVCADVGISDHSVIEIGIIWGECGEREINVNEGVDGLNRWKRMRIEPEFVEWYRNELCVKAETCGMDVYEGMNAREKACTIREWISEVNDVCLGKEKEIRKRKVKWWNERLFGMRREVRRARGKMQHARKKMYEDRCDRNEKLYKEERRKYVRKMKEYKDEMCECKEKEWREYVRVEGNKDAWGGVYKICMGKRKSEMLSAVKKGDGMTEGWCETMRYMFDEFFPEGDRVNVDELSNVNCMNENDGVAVKELGYDEVVCAVRGMKRGKAPGWDGITPEMILHVWGALPQYLFSLYDACLKEKCFPEEWKRARVVVLRKSPDKDREDVRSYRPISLLACLGKVYESVLIKRLNECINNGSGMNEAQYGFRKGRSIENAWVKLKEYVRVSECKYVCVVSVDFKGAFDNLQWGYVLKCLNDLKCGELDVWKEYYKERKVFGVNGSDRVDKCVTRGCPQGSISGPVHWNVCMNVLLNVLSANEWDVCAYADDVMLIVRGNSRVELEKVGNKMMNAVYEWGVSAGVSVSETKTVCMMMKGSFSWGRMPVIRVNGVKVKWVRELRYLGVTVTERMRFEQHLRKMKGKIASVVGKLRRVMRKEWGLRRRVVRILYKGLLTACAVYGAVAWEDCLRYDKYGKILRQAQRVAMYASMNVCKTVSNAGMEVMMGVLPWKYEVRKRVIGYKVRMKDECVFDEEWDCLNMDEVNDLEPKQCMSLVSERLMCKWQEEWNDEMNGRVLYEWVKDVRVIAKHEWVDPCREMGYLMTGHGPINEYLCSLRICDSPKCDCGADVENWMHVLTECVFYDDLRVNVLNDLYEDGQLCVAKVLVCKEKYERVNVFAKKVFARRRERVCVNE